MTKSADDQPPVILCSPEYATALTEVFGQQVLELEEFLANKTVETPLFGAILASEDDCDVVQSAFTALNLDLPTYHAQSEDDLGPAIGTIFSKAVHALETVNQTTVRQLFALQKELERQERAFGEMERFLDAAAIPETTQAFSNISDDPDAELVMGAAGIAPKGEDLLTESAGFHIRLPVRMSSISCIRLCKVWGILPENGAVVFSLKRGTGGEPLVTWVMDVNFKRGPDGEVLLYLPEHLSTEDIAVNLHISGQELGESVLYFPLAARKGDPQSHLYFEDGKSYPYPIEFEIISSIPYLRSTPFAGCLLPENLDVRKRRFQISSRLLFAAEKVLPTFDTEFPVVTKQTFTKTGLLVHPLEGEVTCAQINLPALPEATNEFVLRFKNDSTENQGAQVGALACKGVLSPPDLQERIRNYKDWAFLAPGQEGLIRAEAGPDAEQLYVFSKLRDGAHPAFAWILLLGAQVLQQIDD